jgi:hypothetical protein
VRAKPKRDRADVERLRGQQDQILSMLIAAGPAGCVNSQLWAVCHAVNSRISDLRKRGHKITAESEGRGKWRYRLITPPAVAYVPASDYARRPQATESECLPLFDKAQP